MFQRESDHNCKHTCTFRNALINARVPKVFFYHKIQHFHKITFSCGEQPHKLVSPLIGEVWDIYCECDAVNFYLCCRHWGNASRSSVGTDVLINKGLAWKYLPSLDEKGLLFPCSRHIIMPVTYTFLNTKNIYIKNIYFTPTTKRSII